MSSSEPVVIKDFKRSHLMGLVTIDYHVEDRRPDLTEEECQVMPLGKYKHFLNLRVGLKRYNWTFRTHSPYEELPWE